MLKRYMFFALFFAFAVQNAFSADYKVMTNEEGQQAMIDEYRAVTIFLDEPVKMDGIIASYLDSSELESKGYNSAEWYYLKSIGENSLTVEVDSRRLKLPSFVATDRKRSTFSIQLKGTSGSFTIHGVKISVTVTSPGTVTPKIEE